jgi:hypothetical protein
VRTTNAEHIRQADLDAFVSWEVNSANSCHAWLPLTLLVAWVLADHPNTAVPTNDATVVAHLLCGGSDFHPGNPA